MTDWIIDDWLGLALNVTIWVLVFLTIRRVHKTPRQEF